MKKIIIAMAAAGLLVASTGARADAFARAYNEVTNLVITGTNGVSVSGSVNNSSATACAPNGTCVSQGGAGFTDSPAAQVGWPGYANNSYAMGAQSGNYALADASIDQSQLTGAAYTRARNLAEGSTTNSTANATAGNSSATLLNSTIVVGGPGATVNFRFDADPYVQAYLTANAIQPAQAEGSLALNFNIIDNRGQVVFNWAPDGTVGGIRGGVENADAFTLNTSLTAVVGNNGPLVYDPTNCMVGSLTGGCFSATTDTLAAGVYTLNVSMRENVNVQSPVPEPATYAMLGAGLLMLGFMARRRKS